MKILGYFFDVFKVKGPIKFIGPGELLRSRTISNAYFPVVS